MRQVLIVDDDVGTLNTYSAALRNAGFEVYLADCGQVAISILAKVQAISAMLLDLNLGDMTGYDVLRWMRSSGQLVPTAVMTAFRIEFDPDEAIALGAAAYVDQPLWLGDIVDLAERLSKPPSRADDPESLHDQVLRGAPGALECLDSVFLEALPQRLKRAFSWAPLDFAIDATVDASLEYGADPGRFDRSRLASVLDFVFVIARRNLMDRLRAETALKSRESAYAKNLDLVAAPEIIEQRSELDLWAAIVAVTIDARERSAAEVWLDQGGTEMIAQALGVAHLPPKEQQREVKRFKDRLLKRLSRYVSPKSQP